MAESQEGVTIVGVEEGERKDIPGGSWVCELVSERMTGSTHTTMGFSVWKPGTATDQMVHDTEELAFIVAGEGKLAVGDQLISYRAGQGLHIPAGVPHGVVNDGEEDMTMVYIFAHPEYPPTRPATEEERGQQS